MATADVPLDQVALAATELASKSSFAVVHIFEVTWKYDVALLLQAQSYQAIRADGVVHGRASQAALLKGLTLPTGR